VDHLERLAVEHLLLRLRPLGRALRALVARQARAAAELARPDVTPLCVTDEQVALLLDQVGALGAAGAAREGPEEAVPEEEARREAELRAEAEEGSLPLDRLRRALDLSAFEEEALLLAAAPEVDRRYERIFAFALDDLNRRQPCAELLCAATARTDAEELSRRALVGRYGRLRRAGLLLPVGEAPSELRQEVRVAPALLQLLLTGQGDPEAFRDPAEVALEAGAPVPPGVDEGEVERLAAGLRRGAVGVVGVFGPRSADDGAAVRALAARAGRGLRRLTVESAAGLDEALATAAAVGAIGWLETDGLTEPGLEKLRGAVAERLARRGAPVVLSGVHPWRPAELLAARGYAELEVAPAGQEARVARWRAALPELPAAAAEELAARFRMAGAEIAAVARTARTRARLDSNGRAVPVEERLEAACAVVVRRRCDHFASLVQPRRTLADLVLPPELLEQVAEIARFQRAWPRVTERWRFGRLIAGQGGIKALFAGESGTGKTLAAEVVAGELGVPLLKVDLARIVSKWVGETEKNLEAAFREAEESHSILFFDEADALFGRRGEVTHGTDRYANLEVSYLLQRLEDHAGLVILATNLKENVDDAFTRRFHVMVHFPRPAVAERRRIWSLAFPAEAPLGEDVDLEALARLDLTGAGITGTARTAALLAADEGADAIHMPHLVQAVHRQFHREARLLTAADLGPHARAPREAGA
jgi:hypothetical protein